MLLYAKISKMTSFVLNSSEQIAKIINLIANDLTVLEQRTAILIHISVFPMMLIGVTIILFVRIGWPSLIGVLLILLIIPIIIKISSINAAILKEVNALKDKRVLATSQAIEGIKQIKFNCWEQAFKRIIQITRNSEIGMFKKLAFGRAL